MERTVEEGKVVEKEGSGIYPLDLEQVTSFKINDRYYIKFEYEDKEVKILEDLSPLGIREQFEMIQLDLDEAKTEDGKLNAQKIFEYMYSKKIEVAIEEKKEMLNSELTNEESLSLQAINKTMKSEEYSGNKELGIYLDEENELLKTTRDGNIMKVENITETSQKNDEIYLDETLTGSTNLEEEKINSEINDEYKIINLAEKREFLLKEAARLKALKQASLEEKSMTKEKPMQLVKIKQDFKQAGFLDALLLSLLTGAFVGSFITIVLTRWGVL